MTKKLHSGLLHQILDFLTNKKFILHLLGILGSFFMVLFLVMIFLRIYTHHGQKLEMPDFTDRPVSEAIREANRKSFDIIVNDSVHIVGKSGGMILNQNPRGGAFVKSGRKVYVTVSKYNPDLVDIADVLPLYGQDYEMKRSELQRKSISAQIKEYRYDPLTNNSILEVWRAGELIISRDLDPSSIMLEKGSMLEFVLSSPEGGSHEVPDMVGVTLKRARWIANKYKLTIGNISVEGDSPADIETAVVIRQSPEADGQTTLSTGAAIDLVLRKNE